MKAKPKPIVMKRIFWDLDFEVINYYMNAHFAIERIFELGDVKDIQHSRLLYCNKLIPKYLLKTSFYPK
jgi:hypothetical protein